MSSVSSAVQPLEPQFSSLFLFNSLHPFRDQVFAANVSYAPHPAGTTWGVRFVVFCVSRSFVVRKIRNSKLFQSFTLVHACSRLFTLFHAIFAGGGRGALDPGSLNSQPPTRVFTGTKTPARHT